MRVIILTLLAFATLSTSKALAQEKKVVVEEIIAVVGNQSISMSDLYETTEKVIENRKKYGVQSKLQPAEEALESLLERKLLSTYARLDSLDKNMPSYVDEEVQRRMDDMVKKSGSTKELEKRSGKAIFQLREDYKKDITEEILSYMQSNAVRRKASITFSEVAEFYNTLNIDSLPLMPPQVSYAQIVKMPPATQERKFEVRQRLLEMRENIMKGEKLSVLARLYSADGSRNSGGEFRSTYDGAVAPFAEAVKQLNPGQISEIVETEFGFHLIEVVSKTETDFFVRHILLKPEFTIEESVKVTDELDSLATAIRAGKTTFAEAALRHSDDSDTKYNGGQNYNIRAYYNTGDIREASPRFILDQLDPMDSRKIERMSVSDVSDPYQNIDIRGNMIYKIITVTEIIPAHKVDLVKDFMFIESMALHQKQEAVLKNWMTKSINDIYIYINPEYMHYNQERDGWKKQSAKYTNN